MECKPLYCKCEQCGKVHEVLEIKYGLRPFCCPECKKLWVKNNIKKG